MASVRHRGAEIRQFLLEHVEQHPRDIVALTAQTFGISRQGVHRHLQRLLHDKALLVRGSTRDRRYTLCPRVEWVHTYILSTIAQEDVVWRSDIRPLLGDLPENVIDIWQYGFTEMFNNAIEHSVGHTVLVGVTQTALNTKMIISDDGEGIFKKLQRALGLEDERHAVLELAKGKMTTDPAHHTGEGIFFTSRMFDGFHILSGNVYFTHMREEAPHEEAEDWITEQQESSKGTIVWMSLNHTSSRTLKEVFDQFTSEGEYSFNKTVVPVRLAQYGDEKLISRSQAKRLLARIDRFKVVLFDFEGVEMIGQAFADEVFRVFAEAHPHIDLFAVGVNTAVEHMIRRAAGHRAHVIIGAGEEAALC
jgi:anti-sigma regulatory factor (Ser/Thr protein kinase)/23S rRNA pseudoU1915 N3-methylase RlmH